jgi:hypothetical protein
MKRHGGPQGMKGSLLIRSGQSASQTGTLMTSLALILCAYGFTGRAAKLALMAFFSLGPQVLFGPLANAQMARRARS